MCSVRGDVLCEGCLWCVRTLCGVRSGEVPDEGNRKLLKHLRRFGEAERNPFHCGLVFPSNPSVSLPSHSGLYGNSMTLPSHSGLYRTVMYVVSTYHYRRVQKTGQYSLFFVSGMFQKMLLKKLWTVFFLLALKTLHPLRGCRLDN